MRIFYAYMQAVYYRENPSRLILLEGVKIRSLLALIIFKIS
jgi:hypothetical protein